MLSLVFSTLFVGSASAFKVAPQMVPTDAASKYGLTGKVNTVHGSQFIWDAAGFLKRSELEGNLFECGMCGGSAEGCPMCRGPSPKQAGFLEQSELEANLFECGMCGGSAEGCPMCRGPSPKQVTAVATARAASSGFSIPRTVLALRGSAIKWDPIGVLDGKSELEVNRFECDMCGGSAEGCPMCRGPSPTTFNLFDV